MPVARLRVLVAAVFASGTGCANEFTPSAPPAIEVLTREVLSDTMAVGDSIDVEIRLTDAGQARDFVLRVEWSSSADTIVSVVPGATAVDSAQGSVADSLGARLHASLRALRHGTATVTVRVNHLPFAPSVYSKTILVRERWIAVAAGDSHSCAVNSAGDVYCWGGGAGIASPFGGAYAKPTRVPLGSAQFDHIAAGSERSCASNTVTTFFACWGISYLGELGAGPYVGVVRFPQVMAGMRELAMRRTDSCGITADVYVGVSCWGWTGHGAFWRQDYGIEPCNLWPGRECGYVVGENPFLEDEPDLRSLVVGDQHACVLSGVEGRVICWGRNEFQQVMPATEFGPTFRMDDSRSGFVSLSAGSWHTCGVNAAAEVWCWGLNLSRQSGDLTGTECDVPGSFEIVACSDGEPVRDPQGIALHAASVSAGFEHSCAVTSTHAIACWGSDDYGQLGAAAASSACRVLFDGSFFPPLLLAPTAPCRSRAFPIIGAIRFSSVSAGAHHSCGVTLDRGAIYCWGDNESQQLGSGRSEPIVATPTRVIEP